MYILLFIVLETNLKIYDIAYHPRSATKWIKPCMILYMSGLCYVLPCQFNFTGYNYWYGPHHSRVYNQFNGATILLVWQLYTEMSLNWQTTICTMILLNKLTSSTVWGLPWVSQNLLNMDGFWVKRFSNWNWKDGLKWIKCLYRAPCSGYRVNLYTVLITRAPGTRSQWSNHWPLEHLYLNHENICCLLRSLSSLACLNNC